jgi:hypothetical protein
MGMADLNIDRGRLADFCRRHHVRRSALFDQCGLVIPSERSDREIWLARAIDWIPRCTRNDGSASLRSA